MVIRGKEPKTAGQKTEEKRKPPHDHEKNSRDHAVIGRKPVSRV